MPRIVESVDFGHLHRARLRGSGTITVILSGPVTAVPIGSAAEAGSRAAGGDRERHQRHAELEGGIPRWETIPRRTVAGVRSLARRLSAALPRTSAAGRAWLFIFARSLVVESAELGRFGWQASDARARIRRISTSQPWAPAIKRCNGVQSPRLFAATGPSARAPALWAEEAACP
jgi:hypothetical protein